MAIRGCCGEPRNISNAVYFLIVLFGLGSWIAVNGLWVELPLLVQVLPEGWSLPSYLAIIVQLANIGPILFTLGNKFLPRRIREVPAIFVLVIIGAIACLLLTYFWKYTAWVAGAERSVPLLFFTFLIAIVDCTSSVTFLPFMSMFKPEYMTALFIGEGLSGFLPSIVALVQGTGGATQCVNVTIYNRTTNTTSHKLLPHQSPPLFGVEVFFYVLFGIMLICGFSFTLLNYLPRCRQEQIHPRELVPIEDPQHNYSNPQANSNHNPHPQAPDKKYSYDDAGDSRDELLNNSVRKPVGATGLRRGRLRATVGLTKFQYGFLLIMTGWINALSNGALPSIQSYACLPYGNIAYHLSVTLANISNPIACLVAFFHPTKSRKVLTALAILGSCLAGYILVLAGSSPVPPLANSAGGAFMVVSGEPLSYSVCGVLD